MVVALTSQPMQHGSRYDNPMPEVNFKPPVRDYEFDYLQGYDQEGGTGLLEY
jgi:hypothetical protein